MLASRRINELNLKEKALQEINLSWQKETLAKRESLQTRLAVAGVILTAEIYIAVCVKGGFVRHYAGDVLAVILLYALARAIFSVTPSNLALKIFAFAAALEIAQYFGVVQILGIENKILKIMIGGTFDLTDLLCYAAGCILASAYEKFEKKEKRWIKKNP